MPTENRAQTRIKIFKITAIVVVFFTQTLAAKCKRKDFYYGRYALVVCLAD